MIRSAQKDPALPLFRGLLALQLQASASIIFQSPCKVTRIVMRRGQKGIQVICTKTVRE